MKKKVELIPCCDRNGKECGRPIPKDWAHKKGVIHPTAHVLIFNTQGKLIVQLRKETKQTHPLHWDISSAGHIDWGESPLDAALRETREELGLEFQKSMLSSVGGWYSASFYARNKTIDREFNWVFICNELIDDRQLRHQPEEILRLDACPMEIMTTHKTWNHYPIVPQHDQYWLAVREKLSLLRLQPFG